MLRSAHRITGANLYSRRWFHVASAATAQALQQKQLRPNVTSSKPSPATFKYKEDEKLAAHKTKDGVPTPNHVKRNAAGVQLLSRSLHEQIFKNCSFPSPPSSFTNIALEHLSSHDLDPTQSSVLPSTDFTLPPLQGSNLLQHFHRIGMSTSEPYMSLAKSFIDAELPPRPENWDIQSGWTKYHHRSDGSSFSEHVPYPMHNGQPEQLLTFDVETMPKYHQFPIIACAASPNAWYAWLSPWILDPESSNPDHLIPLGPADIPRVVVGHNVSYDRGRIQEEYHLDGTRNRFIDTMALHVAVKGISSHQRPAWMKHRKNKDDAKERKSEAFEAVLHLMDDVQTQLAEEVNEEKKSQLQRLLDDLQQSLPGLEASLAPAAGQAADNAAYDATAPSLDAEDSPESTQKRWEDLTSANSLVDVAKLHCSIDISKEIRSDFMTATPADILASISDYMTYCASDVYVTHCVYSKVLPQFLTACPHPVSFAGILTMGSGFLPVNQEWERYIETAEGVYMKMERKVRDGLADLAREALDTDKSGAWRNDVWLSQLDWTPKVAGKSRGIFPPEEAVEEPVDESSQEELIPAVQDHDSSSSALSQPEWYLDFVSDPFSKKSLERIAPLLLRLSYLDRPLLYNDKERWHYLDLSDNIARLSTSKGKKTTTILSSKHILRYLNGDGGEIGTCDIGLAERLSAGERDDAVRDDLLSLARQVQEEGAGEENVATDPWLSQLNWKAVEVDGNGEKVIPLKIKKPRKSSPKPDKPPPVYWPKWYWELTKPKKDMPPGTLDITIRNRISPLLLKMSWHDCPLFHSREHGWIFRVPGSSPEQTPDSSSDSSPSSIQDRFKRLTPLSFYDPADDTLAEASLRGGYAFYKLPHKDGEKANVGSPLGKGFMKFAMDGVLKGAAGKHAKEVVDVNVQCSYWVSARDRIMNQMVGWQDPKGKGWDMGFPPPAEVQQDASDVDELEGTVVGSGEVSLKKRPEKWGIILPQMITMGTVTRRAIEKTWLTASNAKKNRVGSELKAMVRAPPGYAIVGADVDSEELWISSCMGDAQFGLHGATAIGWMTLEGTKSAGTDLHSKTASILGISRDQAKVFNYSRIYGAGMRHAVLLLLQGNSGMLPEEAQKLAENLYASTKGKNTHRTDIFDRKFWYGGTESYLFNKLEEIAMSDKPQTPALGCGVTQALSKEFLPVEFGADYMPSRINWVVQSSGVDYLHLLIVSMDHLLKAYDIKARFLISVHDELRYLVRDEDKYRAALALQIANLWTRSIFSYKLGMDDLPQGVAFFSAVDVDRVLRKEVDMPCVTPSQPIPIPPGESYDITQILAKTNGGSLWQDGSPMQAGPPKTYLGSLDGYVEPNCLTHRARNAAFLRAQATSDFGEVKHLARQATGTSFSGGPGGGRPRKKRSTLGNGEGVDWTGTVERLLKSGRELNMR